MNNTVFFDFKKRDRYFLSTSKKNGNSFLPKNFFPAVFGVFPVSTISLKNLVSPFLKNSLLVDGSGKLFLKSLSDECIISLNIKDLFPWFFTNKNFIYFLVSPFFNQRELGDDRLAIGLGYYAFLTIICLLSLSFSGYSFLVSPDALQQIHRVGVNRFGDKQYCVSSVKTGSLMDLLTLSFCCKKNIWGILNKNKIRHMYLASIGYIPQVVVFFVHIIPFLCLLMVVMFFG